MSCWRGFSSESRFPWTRRAVNGVLLSTFSTAQYLDVPSLPMPVQSLGPPGSIPGLPAGLQALDLSSSTSVNANISKDGKPLGIVQLWRGEAVVDVSDQAEQEYLQRVFSSSGPVTYAFMRYGEGDDESNAWMESSYERGTPGWFMAVLNRLREEGYRYALTDEEVL
jgi:hypothetical protein